MKQFVPPIFGDKCLELRYSNGEVCIYGNQKGIKKLSEFCLKLASTEPDQETKHIHLEDFDILTSDSLRGVISVFKSE